jgi:hypothetical protein
MILSICPSLIGKWCSADDGTPRAENDPEIIADGGFLHVRVRRQCTLLVLSRNIRSDCQARRTAFSCGVKH